MHLSPLCRVLFTEGCVWSLFTDFLNHIYISTSETGWLLLGERRQDECVVQAVLPPGPNAQQDNHRISFDRDWQCEMVRRLRRRRRDLLILGLAHTHPPGCERPSDADLFADRMWSGLLPGHEGVYGIGVVVGDCLEMRWWSLAYGGQEYTDLPWRIVHGKDLAAEIVTGTLASTSGVPAKRTSNEKQGIVVSNGQD